MKVATVYGIAAEHDAVLAAGDVDVIVDDPNLRDTISLVAYANDLLGRMKGIAAGPAVLVLWRGSAWTREGSPRKKFRLSADMILESEKRLCEVVLGFAGDLR